MSTNAQWEIRQCEALRTEGIGVDWVTLVPVFLVCC